ncbi:MAG: response regulator transcription factor [Candidatus Aminicenantes bacterium]|nr:response regulator transcription factor [Candidatus Aminicenantes bacterium]
MKNIKVILAEDHTIVRKGLRSLLDIEEGIKVVGEAENGKQVIKKVAQLKPDVVVMDIAMPLLNGLEATRRIKKDFPRVRVLVLSVHEDEEYIFQTLKAGASGYLLKNAAPTDLVSAIKAAYRNEAFLSPSISKKVVKEYIRQAAGTSREENSYEKLTNREREVLQLLAEGRTVKEIAHLLYLSTKTVQAHRAHLREKLNINSNAELIKYAIRKGLIKIE